VALADNTKKEGRQRLPGAEGKPFNTAKKLKGEMRGGNLAEVNRKAIFATCRYVRPIQAETQQGSQLY